MLSKCANPACLITFRYLSEGRLYVVAPRAPRSIQSLEFGWLCSSCCLYLTIKIDEEIGMRVVWKCQEKCREENGTVFDTVAPVENRIATT